MADIQMPQLGETVTEGTITKWFKAVGDQVAEDEPLFEVSTDKVDSEVPSPAAGYLTEIKVNEGDTVDVGTVLAVLSDQPGGGGNGASAEPALRRPRPSPTRRRAGRGHGPRAGGGRAGAGRGPGRRRRSRAARPPTEVAAPAEPATGARRRRPRPHRAGGDALGPRAVTGGAPAHRRAQPRPHLHRGHRRRWPHHPQRRAPRRRGWGGTPRTDRAGRARREGGPRRRARPARRARCRSRPPRWPTAKAGERDTVVPLNNIRKRTAEHMVRSKATSPHVFTIMEVDFEAVEKARRAHREEFKAHEGFSLTYLPFIARAMVDALAEFPHMNATVGDGELIVHNYINIGVAVDLNYEGLIVPVIHDAQDKRLRASPGRSPTSPTGPARRSSRPTTSPAARSRSPTPAAPARSPTCRSSTSRR